jgi:DNA-binding CsgD family transcriptional regulator
VADRLQARREEFIAALIADLERRAPELVLGDPEVLEGLRRVSVANFDSALEGVRGVAEGRAPNWSRGEPVEAADHARSLARRGVPLELLLRAYRRAHSVGWDMTFADIMASGLEEPAKTLLLTGASHFQFDYFDHLISLVTEAYTREFERRTRGSEQRRVRAVSRVLAGEAASSDELGYRLEGHHLAMVVRGPGAESAARGVAATLDREALVVSRTAELAWLWLGSRRPFDARAWKRLHAHRLPAGIVVAAGESQSAREGFRLSHQQAQIADRASAASGRPLTRYVDGALLAAVLEHDTAEVSFARTFLGELAGPGSRNATLRATLQAYFSAGQNASSAAAVLGVSERTVRYRLRRIEQILDHAIDARRAELEVALRIVDARAATSADS